MKPAVFIDRDGTINEQRGYVNHISRFVLLPGVGEAISLLNKNNHLVVVTSNQSGVAQGYFPVELVHETHELMKKELAKDNAYLNGVYFCPHHPHGIVSEYKKECRCRKYVIGDRWLDIDFAHNANLPGILVLTGYGRGDLEYIVPHKRLKPTFVADDLLRAVTWILQQDSSF